MKTVKIRFNTENTGKLFWRVIIDGKEHLADNVIIETPTRTTQDLLPNGITKWHISTDCEEITWQGTTVILS